MREDDKTRPKAERATTPELPWDDPLEPHPRDILKREWDEQAKRPRDIALEKHGDDIEAQIERDIAREKDHRDIDR